MARGFFFFLHGPPRVLPTLPKNELASFKTNKQSHNDKGNVHILHAKKVCLNFTTSTQCIDASQKVRAQVISSLVDRMSYRGSSF